MVLAKYKACICEGAAENAIMDTLLDYGLLIFSRKKMKNRIDKQEAHLYNKNYSYY